MTVYRANKKVVIDYGDNDFQPCWTCQKACGGCSWSRDFEPVKGWVADKNYLRSNGEFADTYKIIKCPEYECDRRYGMHKKGEC